MSNKRLYDDSGIDLFPCYSVPLKEFLSNKGIKYKIVGDNPNTGKTMWVYVCTQMLDNALKEWRLGGKQYNKAQRS